MVRGGLSAVANQLESANHLTNGEEAEALSKYDTASSQLTRGQAADLLDEVLRRPEDGAALDGLPQGLVVALEGGDGTTDELVSVTGFWHTDRQIAYGGLIFWAWKTILPVSRATVP